MQVDMNQKDMFLNEFSRPDEDACNSDIIENTFSLKYYASYSHNIPNTSFGKVLSQNKSKEIAFISTDNKVIYFDVNTFSIKLSFNCHTEGITGLKFATSNPNLLYTSSMDATIKMWDLRCNKEESTFTVDNAESKMPLTAFDVSKSENILCGGTECVNEAAFMIFWDIRQHNTLGGYWESHFNDITCVKFNNVSSNILATSGCDNILNIFDISQQSEVDSLIYTLNTENIINTFCWTSKNEKEKLLCFTDVYSLQLWDIKDSRPLKNFNRQMLTKAMKRSKDYECYYIPFSSENSSPDPLILTGSGLEHTNYTCLRTLKLDMQLNKLIPHGMLIKDKQEVTQCAIYYEDEDTFLTIGENGSINLWKPNANTNNLKVHPQRKSNKIKPY